jgi:hypothetical protein
MQRISLSYFEGVNSIVQHTLAKKTELSHAENVRTAEVGTISKRGGQVTIGTQPNGSVFVATSNNALFYFKNNNASSKGVFRISNTTLDSASNVSLYSLSNTETWVRLTDASALNIAPGDFDHANANGKMVIINGVAPNRLIEKDGTTVTDASEAGSLFNSPVAYRCAFYKNRIYLGDFTSGTVRYKNMIIRSSYPVGIIALVNGDMDAAALIIPVTDSKYFYSNAGVNTYDVYRGGTLVTTVTVTSIQETTITVAANVQLLSSDEIWVGGSYTGEKQYRWVNNPSSIGRDVKQYDTFKLSGGDEDEITMMETINDTLFIANRNALMSWDDYTLTNSDTGIGCVAKKGYTKLLGVLFFIHYSGIFSTSGAQPAIISRKVERYIKGANRASIENTCAGFKDYSAFFAIGDSTLYHPDGSVEKVLKDVCLEYNTVDGNWFVHTNVAAEHFTNFVDTQNNRLLFTSKETEKRVKAFLEGQSDDGSEIFMRADTHSLQLMREMEAIGAPMAVVAEVTRGTEVKCFASIQDEPFYELEGSFLKGISSIKFTSQDDTKAQPTHGTRIKLSFREGSLRGCTLNQADLLYMPTSLEVPSGVSETET